MASPAIVVDSISKQYKVGHFNMRRSFGEFLRWLVLSPVYRVKALMEGASEDETFWALRDVSLEIKPGEVVGIIGRNGAGKSTLLKVLSRITMPTSGRAYIRGRVGSLLEVGTGFHPELTGRENIYLNGAILGMRRCEIAAKFDDIVEFSEIERFIDTPVKRYSSGMYVRLAFAVAAHLEPEILFVDEVLAVGDMAFQKKCLGKMDDVAKAGRTVLFVSHNMDAIARLCPRGILLDKGRVAMDGPAGDVVRQYLGALADQTKATFRRDTPPDWGDAWVRAVEVTDAAGNPCDTFVMGEPICLRITYEVRKELKAVEMGLTLSNDRGQVVASPNSRQQHGALPGSLGMHVAECRWLTPVLTPRRYFVRVDVGDFYRDLNSVDSAVTFTVKPSENFTCGRLVSPNPVVASQCQWASDQ
jgi:lipopolysaccharide transport system ATP-binding protein